MPKAHPHKADALKDLQNGDSINAVSERYDIRKGTLKVWCTRWRKRGDLPPLQPAVTPSTKGVTPPPAPDNVLPLPPPQPVKRRPGGRSTDPEERAKKLAAYHEAHQQQRQRDRVRAISPVDRESVRRIIRRLVGVQETGLWCPSCPPQTINRKNDKGEEVFNQLTPRELLSTTRALHLNLEKLGPLLEVEDRLKEEATEERTVEHYTSPEGRAELAQSIVSIGPRILGGMLADHPEALRVVQAALQLAQRKTG